jgi:hypothetical protein
MWGSEGITPRILNIGSGWRDKAIFIEPPAVNTNQLWAFNQKTLS